MVELGTTITSCPSQLLCPLMQLALLTPARGFYSTFDPAKFIFLLKDVSFSSPTTFFTPFLNLEYNPENQQHLVKNLLNLHPLKTHHVRLR